MAIAEAIFGIITDLELPGIATHFETLTDPRMKPSRWHDLMDVVVIALCGTICGCDSREDFARYGRQKRDWLQKHLGLRGGTPSPDTFARVFLRLDTGEFLRCLSSWGESLRTRALSEIVAIDGQALVWRSRPVASGSRVGDRQSPRAGAADVRGEVERDPSTAQAARPVRGRRDHQRDGLLDPDRLVGSRSTGRLRAGGEGQSTETVRGDSRCV